MQLEFVEDDDYNGWEDREADNAFYDEPSNEV